VQEASPLVSKVKKMDKMNGPDADNSEWINLEFFMNPDKPASKYPENLLLSRMDDQRWIEWVMAFRVIVNLKPYKEPTDKIRQYQDDWDFVEGSSLVKLQTSS
jgi:hypothetical protein